MARKTILISGGTRGIGKAAFSQLLKDGFNVVTFSPDKNSCEKLIQESITKSDQKNFLVLQGDITNEKDIKKIISLAIAKFKSIDILMNNAGMGYFSEVDKVDMGIFQKMLQLNLFGAVLLTKHIVPFMKKQKAGLIINIVSNSGKMAFAKGEFYSATKFGLMGFSQGIRAELKEYGIKVCTICPGMVKTEFFSKEELERRKKLHGGKIPTMLNVEDINKIISLICSQSEHCDIQDIALMPFD